MQTKLRTILLIIAFISGLLSFIPLILTGHFFFTFDGARDLIWVKNQVDFAKPSLIGPWGSLTGIFFGPLWFWLLSIPYIVSGGNPIAITLFNSLVVFGTPIAAYFMLRKYSSNLAYFVGFLGFISPGILSLSEFAFSQHLLPILTLLLIYSYANVFTKYRASYLYLAALSVSLMFHAEPPTAIFSIPTILAITLLSSYRKKYISIKNILLAILLFLIPFLPQLVFELRHDFIQAKAFAEYIKGGNESLGGVLPITYRIIDRTYKFFNSFQVAIGGNSWVLALFLLMISLYTNFQLVKDKFVKNIFIVSAIYVSIMWGLFIYYKPELKGFYLDGILIIFIIWVGSALTILWQRKKIKPLIIFLLFYLMIINTEILSFQTSLRTNFDNKDKKGGIFKNHKNIVDWIYHDANGKGFNVYTYDPAVYDYHFQYIFLWLGPKKYSYLPEEFSYLPNVPEYVQFKSRQLNKLKDKIKKSEGIIYLIRQKEDIKHREKSWLNNFPDTKYQLISTEKFPDGTLVEKRKEI